MVQVEDCCVLVDLFVAELQLFDQHAEQVGEGEVDALLFFDFFETFLVNFAQVNKEQVGVVVHFHVQLCVLAVGIFPD
jgi:hypothetical protein